MDNGFIHFSTNQWEIIWPFYANRWNGFISNFIIYSLWFKPWAINCNDNCTMYLSISRQNQWEIIWLFYTNRWNGFIRDFIFIAHGLNRGLWIATIFAQWIYPFLDKSMGNNLAVLNKPLKRFFIEFHYS